MLAYSAFRFKGQINKILIFVLAASIIEIYEFTTSSFVGVFSSLLSLLLVMYWNAPITPFRYMATISYSLYVTHYPIVTLFNQTARHFLGSESHPLL
jgi:peptidoglycan/LPS O-acetylase OafA/YrhL